MAPWDRREFLRGMGTTAAAASLWPYLQAQGQLPVAGSSDWARFRSYALDPIFGQTIPHIVVTHETC